VRLDHLLSRVSEPDPYDKIGAPIVLPFAVKGAGSNKVSNASYHFSVVKVRTLGL
jgi:hypothetical protein